jgi:hypothetical protein
MRRDSTLPIPHDATPVPSERPRRTATRRKLVLPARLTWRDASGTLRFVSVLTRDVSDYAVFIDCQLPTTIPMYRLVHFQLEKAARERGDVPSALQRGKVLAAVYRVGPYQSATGTPQGYALRLLVEPVEAQSVAREPIAVAGN